METQGVRVRSGDVHEIVLKLAHPEDMFALAPVDLFSEFRNWLTGMEIAISDLKGTFRRRPVVLRIQLPPEEIKPDLHHHMTESIRSFCTNRLRYNGNEVRSMRRDGSGALVIGLMILIFGLVAQQLIRDNVEATWANVFFADGLFLVTAWVGMWYPLDMLVYYSRPYRLENKALEQLMAAELVIEPCPTA